MKKWIQIRRELYRQLESHVHQILGDENSGIAQYSNEYEKSLRGAWKPAHREFLFEQIKNSDLVLMGDFHALHQSQKAQLRVLKGVYQKQRPMILAVEFLEARHQKLIDRYMRGDLAEKDFLRSIEWQKNWGFPWVHYRPLMRWAQKHKISIYGINRRYISRSAHTLELRDRFSADRIVEIRKLFPEALLVVVYGDLHLATPHLPKQILMASKKKKPQIVTVYQNSERLFFQSLKQGVGLDVDLFRQGKQRFCLQSVPPWVKWQNYLLYLEKHMDLSLEDDDEIDYTDEVARYVQIIEQDLGVSSPIGGFSISTADDARFWEQIERRFPDRQVRVFKSKIERSVSFYVPELEIGYLARPSVNHAAGLAMLIVYSHLSGWKTSLFNPKEDFFRMIWLEAIEYFGSKLINPKRKTDTLHDIKNALAARIPGDHGKEALQIALKQKLSELLWLGGAKRKFETPETRQVSSVHEAARILGGMLGEKLFYGFHNQLLSTNVIRSLAQRPVESEAFKDFYLENLELIESLPDPFLSKTEKL